MALQSDVLEVSGDNGMDTRQATGGRIRKRKAESQDGNDRLSKRLSLLNLGRYSLFLHSQKPKEMQF